MLLATKETVGICSPKILGDILLKKQRENINLQASYKRDTFILQKENECSAGPIYPVKFGIANTLLNNQTCEVGPKTKDQPGQPSTK
jgi:hypothetical protein